VVTEQVNNTNNIKDIANLAVEHGNETKKLSQNLLLELTTLHNLIVQFDMK
jgi:methyl-accepting chemotaxis protein